MSSPQSIISLPAETCRLLRQAAQSLRCPISRLAGVILDRALTGQSPESLEVLFSAAIRPVPSDRRYASYILVKGTEAERQALLKTTAAERGVPPNNSWAPLPVEPAAVYGEPPRSYYEPKARDPVWSAKHKAAVLARIPEYADLPWAT